jgi:hypothetical protein
LTVWSQRNPVQESVGHGYKRRKRYDFLARIVPLPVESAVVNPDGLELTVRSLITELKSTVSDAPLRRAQGKQERSAES